MAVTLPKHHILLSGSLIKVSSQCGRRFTILRVPSPDPAFLRLPTEIIDLICEMATVKSRLQLLRTCRRTHAIVARIIYRDVHVAGPSARLFFSTISAPTATSLVYSYHVKSLTFETVHSEDATITFPLLTEALIRLRYVRKLTLSISPSESEFLLCMMMRRDIVRKMESPFAMMPLMSSDNSPFSILTLPALRHIRVEKDIKLLAIAKYRRIHELTILPVLNYDGLASVVDELGNSWTTSSIEALTIRLDKDIDLASVLWALSDVFVGIKRLGLEIPEANAMVRHLFSI